MITCSLCHKIAKPKSIKFNSFSEEWRDFRIDCKTCAIQDGEFEDWDELKAVFDFESVEPFTKIFPLVEKST